MPYDLIILNIEINFCSNIFSFFNIINYFVFAYFFCFFFKTRIIFLFNSINCVCSWKRPFF